MMPDIIGWDVGGVNTKATHVADGRVRGTRSVPFEIQRDPAALDAVLATLAREFGTASAVGAAGAAGAAHAITMTAELSQMFRRKADGVAFVLAAFERVFPGAARHVYTVRGDFVDTSTARETPLAVAAANWMATAALVAADTGDAILIDIGTTTTDIIPIERGRVRAIGTTDPERLLHAELVYTGAVRTPVEAVLPRVPLHDGEAYVSAESFALTGDAHLWRGTLAAADYATPTPDGRPAAREFAGERLARIVCADRDILTDADIDRLAAAVAAAQVARVTEAIRRVHARHPAIRRAVVTGVGAFIAAEAAAAADLTVEPLSDRLGDAARAAPATAVALLLDAQLAKRLPSLSAPPRR